MTRRFGLLCCPDAQQLVLASRDTMITAASRAAVNRVWEAETGTGVGCAKPFTRLPRTAIDSHATVRSSGQRLDNRATRWIVLPRPLLLRCFISFDRSNRSIRRRAFAGALVVMSLPITSGVVAQTVTSVASHPDEAPFIAANKAAMNKMMAGMATRSTGDVDADFAAMMIPHHQGAIEMAEAELRFGHNEQLRRLAQEIIVDQQGEIAAMRLALDQKLPPSAPAPTGGAAPAASAARDVSRQPMTMPMEQAP